MSKEKKAVATRYYTVKDALGHQRLVEASSQQSAVAHVFGSAGLVAVASAKMVAELLGMGVKIEHATNVPVEQESLPL